MSKLEKALYELNLMERASEQPGFLHSVDPRAKLGVTLVYLVTLLSLPLGNLSGLILFGVYPILLSAMAGVGYGRIFSRSLVVLPFILFIGIFNPVVDRHIVFYVGKLGITSGWISFFSIILRGLFSVQAVMILIVSSGFYTVCGGLRKLGIPALFVTQLLFVYRYIFVLLEEALAMRRARDARGYGRASYPLRMWGIFMGQLLIRTVDRAGRIHKAMLARGFKGSIEGMVRMRWQRKDTFFLVVWIIILVFLRVFHPAESFSLFINH